MYSNLVDSPAFQLDLNSCHKHCLYFWTTQNILEKHSESAAKSPTKKFCDLLPVFQHGIKRNNKWTFFIEQREICASCLRQMFAITEYLFKSLSKYARNRKIKVHGNEGSIRQSIHSDAVISWLAEFIAQIGEQQPNSSFIHLPSYLNKLSLYNDCMEFFKEENRNIHISIPQFYNLWNTNFKNVRIPIQTRLGRCSDCSEFNQKQKDINTPEQKEIWKQKKKAHLKLVREERILLTTRKFTAQVSTLVILT
jgi:hypothetical protein